jgi:hypothetical protein
VFTCKLKDFFFLFGLGWMAAIVFLFQHNFQ